MSLREFFSSRLNASLGFRLPLGLSCDSWFQRTALFTAIVFFLSGTSLLPPLLPSVYAAPAQSGASGTSAKADKVAVYVLPKTANLAGPAQVIQGFLRSELPELSQVLSVVSGAEPNESLQSLIGKDLERGYLALNERQAEKALPHFEKAYALLRDYQGDFDRRLFARAMKGLGVAQAMLGRSVDAESSLIASFNLWPDQNLQDYGWTLDVRTFVSNLQGKMERQMPGSIDVDSDPPGAIVRVDGEVKGISPLLVENLNPGRHWVECTLDGYQRLQMFVDVPDDSSTIHAVELLPSKALNAVTAAKAKVQKSMRANAINAPLQELGEAVNANKVLVVTLAIGQGSFILEGFKLLGAPGNLDSLKTAQAERVSEAVVNDENLGVNLRAFLTKVLHSEPKADLSYVPLDGPPAATTLADGELVINPDDPIFQTPKNEAEDSITDEWWFWVILGGVTAGLVAGGVYLFSAEGNDMGPTGSAVVNIHH